MCDVRTIRMSWEEGVNAVAEPGATRDLVPADYTVKIVLGGDGRPVEPHQVDVTGQTVAGCLWVELLHSKRSVKELQNLLRDQERRLLSSAAERDRLLIDRSR